MREESYGPLRTQIRTKDFAPLFLRRPTSLQQFPCLGSNKTGLLRRNYLRPLLSIMRTSTSAPPFLNHLIRHKPPSPLYFLSQKQKKKKKAFIKNIHLFETFLQNKTPGPFLASRHDNVRWQRLRLLLCKPEPFFLRFFGNLLTREIIFYFVIYETFETFSP